MNSVIHNIYLLLAQCSYSKRVHIWIFYQKLLNTHLCRRLYNLVISSLLIIVEGIGVNFCFCFLLLFF